MVYGPYDSKINSVKLVTILWKHLVRIWKCTIPLVNFSFLSYWQVLQKFTFPNMYTLYCVYRCPTKMVYTLNTTLEDVLDFILFQVKLVTLLSSALVLVLKQLFVIVNIVVQDNFFIRLIILFTFILSLRCWSCSKTLSIMF